MTGKATLAASDFATAEGNSKPYIAANTTALVAAIASEPAEGAAGSYHLYLVTNNAGTITPTDLGTVATINGPLTNENFGRSSGQVEGLATFTNSGTTLTLDETVTGVVAPVTVVLGDTGGSVKISGNSDEQATGDATVKTTALTFSGTPVETNVSFTGTAGYGTDSSTPLVVTGATDDVSFALTSGAADYLETDGGVVTGQLDETDEVVGTFAYAPDDEAVSKALNVEGGKLVSASGLTLSSAEVGTAATFSGTLETSTAAKLLITGTDAVDISSLASEDSTTGLKSTMVDLDLGSSDDGQKIKMTGAQFAQFTGTLTGKAYTDTEATGDKIVISDNKITYTAKTTADAGEAKLVAFAGTISAQEGTIAISGTDTVDVSDTSTTPVNWDGFTTLDLATDANSNTLTLTSDQLALFTDAITGDTHAADDTVNPVITAATDKLVVKAGTETTVDLSNATGVTVDLSDTSWTAESTPVLPTITFGNNAQHVVMTAAVYNAISAAETVSTNMSGAKATDVVELSAAVNGNVNGGVATIQLANATNAATLVKVGENGASVIAGSTGDTITSSAGDDTITLGDGADTVIFAAAASNGTDEIKEFAAGSGKDVLDLNTNLSMTKLLSGALSDATGVSDAATPLALTTNASGTALSVDGAAFIATVSSDDAAGVTALFGTEGTSFSLTDGTGHCVVLSTTNNSLPENAGDYGVWYVSNDGGTYSATQIATVGVDDADGLLIGNFDVSA